MSKIVSAGLAALCAGMLCVAPVSLRPSPVGSVSLSLDRAVAGIGRPLRPVGWLGYDSYLPGYPPIGYGWTYQPCEYGSYHTGNGYGYGMYLPYRSYGTTRTARIGSTGTTRIIAVSVVTGLAPD